MLRALRATVLVLVAAVATANLLSIGLSLAGASAYNKDFAQEYLLARALWDGVDTNVPVAALAEHYGIVGGFFDKAHPTPHPPTAGVVLLPLAALDYVTALRTWFALQVVFLACSVWLLGRATDRPVATPSVVIASFLLAAWPPVELDLGLGQLTLAVLVLLCGADFALVRGRSALCGVLLGVSLLLKPLAWPWLLVLVRRRQWTCIGATLAVVLAGYGGVALREGIDRVIAYFVVVGPSLSASFLREPTNVSLWTVGPSAFPDNARLATLVSAALITVLLGLVWHFAARKRPVGVSLGFATAAAILVSPLTWQFYLVLAILPVAHALTAPSARHDGLLLSALVAVALSPYVPVWLGAPSSALAEVPMRPVVGYALLALPALCALWLAVAENVAVVRSHDEVAVKTSASTSDV